MRDKLVDRLDHVHGHADRARLVGDAARDGLADPPGRVGRELVAAPPVELLDGAHQAEVALLDQVEEEHAATHVALGDRDDEAQVGLDQLAPRLRVAAFDALCERDLFLGREQRHLADLAQVAANRVVRAVAHGSGRSSTRPRRRARRPRPRPLPARRSRSRNRARRAPLARSMTSSTGSSSGIDARRCRRRDSDRDAHAGVPGAATSGPRAPLAAACSRWNSRHSSSLLSASRRCF